MRSLRPTRAEEERDRSSGTSVRLITVRALDLHPREPGPAFGRHHPGPVLEGRLMAHVLGVAAGEVGDPGTGLVRVGAEAEDADTHEAAGQIV